MATTAVLTSLILLAADVDFGKTVAPVLERRCVSCHNAATAKGGLSLETEAATLKGGENGPAVVPGKSDESVLIEKIVGAKPEMPKSGQPLSAAEVAALRAWIDSGAKWPSGLALKDKKFEGETWWAFTPLTLPAVPPMPKWGRNPIDAFVAKTLDERKLTPVGEADRRTLIRRLSFDLLGLPPSPEEVEAFVADASPDAYETLVDRMLASPRYGERWARHWLDVVHYGDTHGYDKDKRRENAWPYRDYVIGALNEDLPYGQFIREQVAGDVLDPDGPRGVMATGFIAAGPWDFVGHVELREGTVDKEKTRLIDRDDMVMNTIGTFNSLTIHCARCHDHKFDPIPQRDYYKLQAVFAGVDRGDRTYVDPTAKASAADLDRRIKAAQDDRAKLLADAAGRVDAKKAAAIDARLSELRARASTSPPSSKADARPSPSNGYHSSIAVTQDVTKWVQLDLGSTVPIDDIRLIPARPTDFPDTPGFGFPVRYRVEIGDDPTFAKTTRVDANPAGDLPNPRDQAVVIEAGGKSARYVRVTATKLWPRMRDYVFALGEMQILSRGKNVAAEAKVSAADSIEAGRWGKARLVDGFDSRNALPDLNDPQVVAAETLRREVIKLEAEQNALVESALTAAERTRRDELDREIKALDAERQAIDIHKKVYTVLTRAPRPIRVLKRGDVEQPSEPVGPGPLACVPDVPFSLSDEADEGRRRLALADWLASPKNPLTWRSIANRVWHYHFGRGIVDTPNDFGRNGSKPTHPELLDWLAAEFLKRGQSLKSLHKLIVTSATYRRSSKDDPACSAIDGENRYLWRMNGRRLEAEAVRDSVLAVSGTLDLTMGGPGFPLFRFKDDHSPIYDHLDPAAINAKVGHRRAIYRFIVRSVSNPFLDCLDAVDPSIPTPGRTTTVTALQALALWNDPFMLDQAGAFARRVSSSAATPEAQADLSVRLALGRPPSTTERDALAAHTRKHGLPATCRLLFNLNEFLFVD